MSNNKKVGVIVPYNSAACSDFANRIKQRLENEFDNPYNVTIFSSNGDMNTQGTLLDTVASANYDYVVLWSLDNVNPQTNNLLFLTEHGTKVILFHDQIFEEQQQDNIYHALPDFYSIGVEFGEKVHEKLDLSGLNLDDTSPENVKRITFTRPDPNEPDYIYRNLRAGFDSVLEDYVNAGRVIVSDLYIYDLTDEDAMRETFSSEIARSGNELPHAIVCFDDRISDQAIEAYDLAGIDLPVLIGFGGTENTDTNIEDLKQTFSVSEDFAVMGGRIADWIYDADYGSLDMTSDEAFFTEELYNGTTIKGIKLTDFIRKSTEEIEVTGVSLNTKPYKSFYTSGENLRFSKITAIEHYSNNTSKPVTLYPDKKTLRFKRVSLMEELQLLDDSGEITSNLKVYKQNGQKNGDCTVTQDMGSSGKGELNLYDRTFKYKFNDFYKCDGSVPISISHIYNPNSINPLPLGYGWITNFDQIVREIDFVDGTTTTKKWEYTDKEGKKYYFDKVDGTEEETAAGRSDIRCNELGLDLFKSTSGAIVTLVDRSANTMLFEKNSNNEYVLSEIHNYPSKPTIPITKHLIKIERLANGNINKIKAGLTPDGKIPCVRFGYDSTGYLVSIWYSKDGTENAFIQYVTFAYSQSNLISIVQASLAGSTIITNTTRFLVSTNTEQFKVSNLQSKDGDGNPKSAIYTFEGSARNKKVTKISIGYSTDEPKREVTVVRGGTHTTTDDHPQFVTGVTELEHNNRVTVTAFNEYSECGSYCYDKGANGSYAKLGRAIAATSNGFDYAEHASKYSNNYDIVHDEFGSDVCGWTGGTLSTAAFVKGDKCLKAGSGKKLVRQITLSDQIAEGTSAFASFWVKGSVDEISIAIKAVNNDVVVKDTPFCTAKNMPDKWQYAAIGTGGLKPKDVITIVIASQQSGDFYIDDFRLTALPYETKTDIPDNEYNAFGNITKCYNYEPITQKVVCTQTDYKADGVTKTAVTVTRGDERISRVEYETNSDGQVTKTKKFGKGAGYTEETKTYNANGVLTSETDENGVTTSHEISDSVIKTSVIGEAGSPTVTTKDEFFANSGKLKQTSALKGQNAEIANAINYNTDGSLKKVDYELCDGVFQSALNFVYDSYGNVKEVLAGTDKLIEYVYDDKNKKTAKFSNDYGENYGYDDENRLVSVTDLENNSVATITYADDDTERVTITHANGVTYTDKKSTKDGETTVSDVSFASNEQNLRIRRSASNKYGNVNTALYQKVYGTDIDDLEEVTTTQNEDGQVTGINRQGIERIYQGYYYDEQSRLTTKNHMFMDGGRILSSAYEYYDDGNKKTSRVKSVTFADNGAAIDTLSYEYYANGNIKTVKKGTALLSKFEYDEFNRLLREYDYANNNVYEYKYDSVGNILSRQTYNIQNGEASPVVIDGYGYTGGRLTSYNGKDITYDAAGNPTNYKGLALEWKGNRLVKFGNQTNCEYDVNGLRLKKYTTNYYWEGEKLVAEKTVNRGVIHFIYYRYDETGVCGMSYEGSDYFFRKNIFGDVIGVYTKWGEPVANFTYDAFGRTLSATGRLADIIHFRYRGYYYDEETGFYYLQSRYYDPETGRFISPDAVEYLDHENAQGLNLYAYCGNNPVMRVDPTGNAWWWILILFICLCTPVGGFFTQVAVSLVSYIGMAITAMFDEEVKEDLDRIKWNPFNWNEDAVNNSNKISFYKGVPVILTNVKNSSLSLGIIFLSRDHTANKKFLTHERGHNTQLMLTGLFKYLLFIGLPSIIKNNSNTPWELSANLFGKSDFSNYATDEQKEQANLYFFFAASSNISFWLAAILIFLDY